MQEFGHRVRLATHANFKSFVRSAGVEFYPLGGDPRVLAGCKSFLMQLYRLDKLQCTLVAYFSSHIFLYYWLMVELDLQWTAHLLKKIQLLV